MKIIVNHVMSKMNTETKVIPNETRKIIETTALVGLSMFFICFLGPTRKKDLKILNFIDILRAE